MGQVSGHLVVRRSKGGGRDRWRSYGISVDRRHRGRIKRGGELVIDVEPGPHTVMATIDWGRSQELLVDVQAGDRVELVVAPGGSAWDFTALAKFESYLKLTRR